MMNMLWGVCGTGPEAGNTSIYLAAQGAGTAGEGRVWIPETGMSDVFRKNIASVEEFCILL